MFPEGQQADFGVRGNWGGSDSKTKKMVLHRRKVRHILSQTLADRMLALAIIPLCLDGVQEDT